MQFNLDHRLIFPLEITTTTLQPDLILWYSLCHFAYIRELTVSWEGAIEEVYKCQKLCYFNLAPEGED